MRRAIVVGSTGYVGSAVVHRLIKEGIETFALGRKDLDKLEAILPIQSSDLRYLKIDSKNIDDLLKSDELTQWCKNNDTVFFNFSWLGRSRLTDGTLEEQLRNVGLATKAVEVASKLGCIKYINSGSQEEYLLDRYLKHDWKNKGYESSSKNYAFAKLLTRDMSTLIGYLEKINYVNTRFSVVIDKDLSGTGYISSTLKKLRGDLEYSPPKNMDLFEILDVHELAEAYFLIGKFGKNKSDYYIRNGEVGRLVDFFNRFSDCKNEFVINSSNLKFGRHQDFDPDIFYSDIKFRFKNPVTLFEEVLNK